MSAARVAADSGRCIGSGQCVLTAPEVFDQDDDGVVIVLLERLDPGLAEEARQAAAYCPVEAITVDPT